MKAEMTKLKSELANKESENKKLRMISENMEGEKTYLIAVNKKLESDLKEYMTSKESKKSSFSLNTDQSQLSKINWERESAI